MSVTAERFLSEVSKHELSVELRDGLHRHLKFKNPASGIYWFDLITWPDFLCICGDCGTYVFRRHGSPDMLAFFRQDELRINPGYWSEKLQAGGRGSAGHEEFSPNKFRDAVKDYFEDFGCAGDDKRQRVWWAIESDVLPSAEDGEHAALQAVSDFKCEGFQFIDFFEYDLMEYTDQFIWCLYAIVWGVQKFDKDDSKDC